MENEFSCLLVEKQGDQVDRRIERRGINDLPPGDVLIKIEYSSLNYKDALAATGHPGVTRQFPHVPGIDAAGFVQQSFADDFRVGDAVQISQAQFGTEHFGGFAGYARVPAEWVYHLPAGMTPKSAMIYGTAGITAAQCLDKLIRHDVDPKKGPVVVSGATGGVGIFAVKLLAKLGYQVIASTGKPDRAAWLKLHGASRVIDRGQLDDRSQRTLLSAQWGGAVDTVGGNTLATIIRATQPHGCVTACGVVGGPNMDLTVYPFILRGVTLAGVDSAGTTRQYRQQLWQQLATDWAIPDLDQLAQEVDLNGLNAEIDRILMGQIAGRVIVRI